MCDLVARTPLDAWPEAVAELALQQFLLLPRVAREDVVSSYWWGAIRQGSWRKLAVTETTWKIATVSKTRSWSVQQVIVAACEWYVRQAR